MLCCILHACEKQPPTLYQQSESNLTKQKKKHCEFHKSKSIPPSILLMTARALATVEMRHTRISIHLLQCTLFIR